MTNSHFCLSSETYKNHVFEGFSRLQQSDEFVDMTLAAGDEYVKVHKTLIALASPYLKVLLQAIPCQHPVIFLSNVNSQELHLILEYIYTGEVNIPPEKIKSFLNAAQAMHISGLKNIVLPAENNANNNPQEEKQDTQIVPPSLRLYRNNIRFPAVKADITINTNDLNFQAQPQAAPNSEIETVIEKNTENNGLFPDFNHEPTPVEALDTINTATDTSANNLNFDLCNNDDNANSEIINIAMNNAAVTNNKVHSDNFQNLPIIIDVLPQDPQQPFLNAFTIASNANGNNIVINNPNIDNPNSFGNFFNIVSNPVVTVNNGNEKDNNVESNDTVPKIIESRAENQEQVNGTDKDKESILYTISSRGSLQLIMNRFMYYSHYSRDNGKKRRWRCIEYRDTHCPAAIDTEDGVIVARKHKHAHPNHDKKIWNKAVKSRVFSSLRTAQDAVNEKQKLPKTIADEVVLSD